MPIYEYTCETCNHTFEHLARTLRDTPRACPSCGSGAIKKGFSTFQAQTHNESAGNGCAHASACPHAHGAGCGCGCC